MLIVLLIFVLLLLVAYAAWHLLPPPVDVIVAVIVAIVAVIYLIANLGGAELGLEHAGFMVLPATFVAMSASPRPPTLSGSGPDTTYQPPAPVEPLPNKALVSALGTVVLVVLRWVVSGDLQLDDEGLIALAGAVTSLLVYAVSNFKRLVGS